MFIPSSLRHDLPLFEKIRFSRKPQESYKKEALEESCTFLADNTSIECPCTRFQWNSKLEFLILLLNLPVQDFNGIQN